MMNGGFVLYPLRWLNVAMVMLSVVAGVVVFVRSARIGNGNDPNACAFDLAGLGRLHRRAASIRAVVCKWKLFGGTLVEG